MDVKKSPNKKKLLPWLLLGFVLSLSGCLSGEVQSKPAERTGPEPDFAEVRPRSTVRDELTVVFSKGEVELDFRNSYLASEAQIYTALYEGLFSYHPFTMEPVPGAAEKWELSEDKKQWTFTIRQDARFWDGSPLLAENFRTAWLSLLAPERNSPYSSLFDVIEGAREYRMGMSHDVNTVGIKASGAKTLVVSLNAPASFFPAMLCHHSFSPIHLSLLNKKDWTKGSLVSNGPFIVDSLNEDVLVLKKNDKYWDARRVPLNKITIKFIEEPDEASSMWNSGEARWLYGTFNWDTLTDRSGIQVNAMFATHYYYICSGEKPWNDHRVRRALVLALPLDEIRGSHNLPAKTLVFPLHGYPEVTGPEETDIDEAKKLLTEAGYPGGKGMPDLVIRLNPSMEAVRIGELMATAWKEKLGVPVRVEVLPYDKYFNSLRESGYTVGASTWIGDFADPYTFLQMWRKDSNLNDAHHSDDDYEKLIDRSMYEEGETRLATLAEAETLLLNRGSVIPISYSPAINVVDTNEIEGWFANSLDIHPFKYLGFKAFRALPGVVVAPHGTNFFAGL